MTYGLLTNEKSLWCSLLERNNPGIYHGLTNMHCGLLLCQKVITQSLSEREREREILILYRNGAEILHIRWLYVTLIIIRRNESDKKTG